MLLLAGCAANGAGNPRMPPPGGTENFNVGYIQGCNSGFDDADWEGWQARYFRDTALFAQDAGYRMGWQQGYGSCYQYGLAHPRPEPDHGGGGGFG
jgi:hypothetical protein